MRTFSLSRTSHAMLTSAAIWMSAMLLISAFVAKASGQLPGNEPSSGVESALPPNAAASDRFTGSLTVRQENGSLYYKIYVVRGTVIGGYDTWRGSSTHYHRIVGGWYDGQRMALLIQSPRNDLGDKWYSHAHHFEKQGDQLVIKHTLYGFGKAIDSGEVYTPHTIEEITELPAEQVQRLAALPERDSSPPAKDASDHATLTKRVKRLERENARLKELVADLALENAKLKQEPRDE